jgi:hypothetical protein
MCHSGIVNIGKESGLFDSVGFQLSSQGIEAGLSGICFQLIAFRIKISCG